MDRDGRNLRSNLGEREQELLDRVLQALPDKTINDLLTLNRHEISQLCDQLHVISRDELVHLYKSVAATNSGRWEEGEGVLATQHSSSSMMMMIVVGGG